VKSVDVHSKKLFVLGSFWPVFGTKVIQGKSNLITFGDKPINLSVPYELRALDENFAEIIV